MARLSDRERAIRQKLRDEFPHYASRCLTIRTKAGPHHRLLLNEAQRTVHERLQKQLKETGKVRAYILKARQLGMSTYIAGRFYWRCTHRRGSWVYILTHERDATNNLFAMVDRFHSNINHLMKPETSRENAKELRFGILDSGYAIGTAGARAAGRSQTIQFFHGSEVAFWPNAQDHFAGVVQTVPDLPGTEIILESTANGIGGAFHEGWQQAEAGESDYEAIFVPWFADPQYRREPSADFSLDDEEAEYRHLHQLDLAQMAWRRARMAELKDPDLFKQEYPATAPEAFQMTGHDSFIKPSPILRARKANLTGIGSLVIGVDPARFGDDGFAIAWRKSRKVEKVEKRHKLSIVQGAGWCREIIERDRPLRMFVDVGGLGAGVYDLLEDWGFENIVKAVNFGDAPLRPDRYSDTGEKIPSPFNRRAEMWLESRDWLDTVGGVDIPDSDALQQDACAPKYTYNSDQRLVLESKEKMRARGIRSPDEWDAVALTFAEPVGTIGHANLPGPQIRKGFAA